MSEEFNFGAMLDALGDELKKEISDDAAGINAGGGFTLVPAGKYRAKVVKAVEGNISQAGNRQMSVTWQIEGGASNSRLVFERVVFTQSMSEKQAHVFFRKWAARGVSMDTMRLNPTPDQLGAMIIGNYAVVTIKHEPGFNDATKIYAAVSWVEHDTGATPDDPAPRPATASGAFGGVPTGAGAAGAAPPVLFKPAVPSIPTPNVSGLPKGL
jgi:hypothetical protein